MMINKTSCLCLTPDHPFNESSMFPGKTWLKENYSKNAINLCVIVKVQKWPKSENLFFVDKISKYKKKIFGSKSIKDRIEWENKDYGIYKLTRKLLHHINKSIPYVL